MPTCVVESYALIWTSIQKVTNNHQGGSAHTSLFFFNYKKTIIILIPRDKRKKIEVKKSKVSLDLRMKKELTLGAML
jgi:hypothetical protein